MRTTHRYPVNLNGSRRARLVLTRLGWRMDLAGLPARQGVTIVYPHTSGKALFKLAPFGAWMRWVGGIPIDRSTSRGVVGQMVHVFEQHKQSDQLLWLGLAPEGACSLAPGWRSGFYQLALGAQVPLALVNLGGGQRRFSVADFANLTGDVERDHAHMAQVFQGVKGFHEHQMDPCPHGVRIRRLNRLAWNHEDF